MPVSMWTKHHRKREKKGKETERKGKRRNQNWIWQLGKKHFEEKKFVRPIIQVLADCIIMVFRTRRFSPCIVKSFHWEGFRMPFYLQPRSVIASSAARAQQTTFFFKVGYFDHDPVARRVYRWNLYAIKIAKVRREGSSLPRRPIYK